MSKYSLRKILNTEELVIKNPICTTVLNSGLDFFLFPDRCLGGLLKHRTSIEEDEYVIVLTGGFDDDVDYVLFSRDISCFVLSIKAWQSLCPLPGFCLPETGAIFSSVCGGRLYVMGESGATVSCFNPQKYTWKSKNTEFPSEIIIYFTVTSFSEDLYVIGGVAKSGRVTCEAHKYNPISNKWKQLTSMEIGRADHCAVVLEDFI